jgi:Ca2+-binding EF-hand superfamily protein
MKNLILLSTLILASGVSFADESNDKLAKLDADKDGRISVAEAAADEALTVMFGQLDTDKDGYLSANELANSVK